MSTSIEVPALGESITEAIVARWLKQPGEAVETDEPLVELETDKITVEVPSPSAGVLSKQLAEEGATVNVGDAIAEIEEGASASAAAPAKAESKPAPAPAKAESAPSKPAAMPAAQAEAKRQGVDVDAVEGSGRGGRVLKEDVQKAAAPKAESKPAPAPAKAESKPAPAPAKPAAPRGDGSREERVPMSRLRKKIAENLVQAQHNAAILTTFNECDMSAVMDMRNRYKDSFVKKHDVKLGFMSFFVKATVHALQEVRSVNARIEGDDIVYNNFFDIGVAVGGGKGLVVPVIRDADRLSFAQIESEILRLADLAKRNKLQISDLTGGTFTISNGGIYGSMLSTPILNPPQSGILGLHNIVDRPIAVDGKVEIRPVMYLALSYDHRLVDGREAVTFLVRLKEAIENPERLLLEV